MGPASYSQGLQGEQEAVTGGQDRGWGKLEATLCVCVSPPPVLKGWLPPGSGARAVPGEGTLPPAVNHSSRLLPSSSQGSAEAPLIGPQGGPSWLPRARGAGAGGLGSPPL